MNGDGSSTLPAGNSNRAEKPVAPVTRFDNGRPSSAASAAAVALPAASTITRYFGMDSGAWDSSTAIGRPRNVPVSASLLMLSRSIITVPARSVSGALNPSILALPRSENSLAVNEKFFASRMGMSSWRLNSAAPSVVTFPSCLPSISLIGLLTESCRSACNVVVLLALIVKNGLRKSSISMRASRTTLPAVIA